MAISPCPTCRAPVDLDAAVFAPFCSRRCKLIDLGKWLDGEYSVPGEPASPDEILRERPDDEEEGR